MFSHLTALAEQAMQECDRLRSEHQADPRALEQLTSIRARFEMARGRCTSAAEFLQKRADKQGGASVPASRPQPGSSGASPHQSKSL